MKTTIEWCWDEAFSKFGFGDGPNFTDVVALELESELGYKVCVDTWSTHNNMIMAIMGPRGGKIMPNSIQVGYTDPRDWMPKRVVKHLNKVFGKLSCF